MHVTNTAYALVRFIIICSSSAWCLGPGRPPTAIISDYQWMCPHRYIDMSICEKIVFNVCMQSKCGWCGWCGWWCTCVLWQCCEAAAVPVTIPDGENNNKTHSVTINTRPQPASTLGTVKSCWQLRGISGQMVWSLLGARRHWDTRYIVL